MKSLLARLTGNPWIDMLPTENEIENCLSFSRTRKQKPILKSTVILACLAEGPQTRNQIAEATNINPETVNRVLQRLQAEKKIIGCGWLDKYKLYGIRDSK